MSTHQPQANPLVSAILVNWNGEKWLRKCIESLLEQTYRPVEIVMVDNGSTDNSIAYVRKEFPQVKIVEVGKNLGFARGNNAGIKAASGHYILLLNTDAWLDKDAIEKLEDVYERNNYAVIAPYSTQYDKVQGDEAYESTIDPFGHSVFTEDTSNEGDKSFFISGVCLFFTKDIYKRTRGLDQNFFMYMEDVDWFWRLIIFDLKFAHIKGVYVHHAISAGTGKGISYKRFLWRNQNTLQMLLKNYSVQNLVWVLPLYALQNLIEAFFFLVTLKPKIAWTYMLGWLFNFENLRAILAERRWVQTERILGDEAALKLMYRGSAKLRGFMKFYLKRKAA